MDPKQKSVAELAYKLWQVRGCPHGSPEIDWHDAQRQLSTTGAAKPAAVEAKIDESEMGSFPASDPPASHGADEPPSNADAKWKAAGIDRRSPNPGRIRSKSRGG
jgi:hypothetical protein